MSDPLHIVCPHCDTTNRVLRERLGPGAICGGCKRPLLSSHPLELTADNFDRHLASPDRSRAPDCRATSRPFRNAISVGMRPVDPGQRLTEEPMSARYLTDWMWAQACAVIDEAERMHRQFFRLAAPGRASVTWEPPVDIFEDELELVILVALPGVPAHRIEVGTEAGELVVRADRGLPFAASRGALRRLEIPYGYFERRIRLPEGRLEVGTHELVDGCLILRLRKIAPGETS